VGGLEEEKGLKSTKVRLKERIRSMNQIERRFRRRNGAKKYKS
jgi:hypothetical protein